MSNPTDPTRTVLLTAGEFRRLQADAREFLADAEADDDWFEVPAATLARMMRRAAARLHPTEEN